MTHLCGKGIWLAHASDLQRAAEMITRIDGTHLIAKVGHGPYYFPEAAREMVQRIRSLGHTPLAWVQLTRRVPHEARKAIVKALDLGYEAVVLFLGPDVGPASSLETLSEALIDVVKRVVTVDRRRVDLTVREFDLLVQFARHPGRAYKRTELLDLVWGYGHDGYEHTVNTHINRLRGKIEKDPARPRFILTVWGVGYKFFDPRNHQED